MERKRHAEALIGRAREIARAHTNDRIEAWKNAGRPVVGLFCSYIPPEIVLAAGALPIRLRGSGSEDSSEGDAWLSGRLCTYVRHVASLALTGGYDFLDGQVCCNTCDHVRRATDTLQRKTSIPFHGFVSVPRAPREDLLPYYTGQLRDLLAALSAHTGVEADEAALRGAIRAMNAVGERLARIDALRLLDEPRISGADALAVHVAARSLPPAEFVVYADRLIEALEARPGLECPRGRLVVVGGELDEPRFLDVVEGLGALVVADRLCLGSRGFRAPVDPDAPDPLEAIARATFLKPSCARMIGDFPARFEALARTVRESRADGVLFVRLMFCDPWGADAHNLAHRTKGGAPFPVLFLTREYGIVPTGQLRTRVQAFLERLEIARSRARPRTAGTEGA